MSYELPDELPDPIDPENEQDAENDPERNSQNELMWRRALNAHRNAYVVIVTFEDNFVPFCTEDAETLKEFFTDYNNIRTGVKSYMIFETNEVLKQCGNYIKKLCSTTTVQEEMKVCEDSPVMFLIGHGNRTTQDFPAYIHFSDEGITNLNDMKTTCVFACRYDVDSYDQSVTDDEYVQLREWLDFWEDAVYLQDFIMNTKLVFCMCCNGDAIVKDYLSDMKSSSTPIPDIVYFMHGGVCKTTVAILTALLVIIADSNQILDKDPDADTLYQAVKSSIVTIFKIVNFCKNDIDKFWDFLLEIGCVSKYESLKDKQRLQMPNRFVSSHLKYHYILMNHNFHDYIGEAQKRLIFNDFKSLTLLSQNGEHLVYDSYKTVDSFPSIPNTRRRARKKPLTLIDIWQYYNTLPQRDYREYVEEERSPERGYGFTKSKHSSRRFSTIRKSKDSYNDLSFKEWSMPTTEEKDKTFDW